jgi:hypothetical protein
MGNVIVERDEVFIDCETNGVDLDRHDAWELAWWNLTTGHRGAGQLYIPDVCAFLAAGVTIGPRGVDLAGLRVSRFVERFTAPDRASSAALLRKFIADTNTRRDPVTGEAVLPLIIGSKPTFDQDFVTKALGAFHLESDGFDPTAGWGHHHPLDLGSYALGVLGRRPGSGSFSAASVAGMVGLPEGGHTAEHDVTSGGRAYLLLREAARQQQDRRMFAGAWLDRVAEEGALTGDAIECKLIQPRALTEAERADRAALLEGGWS